MDTIGAIATASGQAGIAVIRISGPRAWEVLNQCFLPASGREIETGRLHYGYVVGKKKEKIDEGMGVFMKAPHSYTREDVAEIQCHGGDVNARRVLKRVLEEGVRLAGPGEFTRRAFENGRLDLSQAEAVMALIGAQSQATARCALRQMEGQVSNLVNQAQDMILDMLALIEAGDDFPEEVEEEASSLQLQEQLGKVISLLERAWNEKSARILRSGAMIALCGRPNTGKSSLMNALLQCERAIVTDLPGTTRDTLSEWSQIGRIPVQITDTAGQRETGDRVEKIGVERAKKAQEQADMVLLVLDGSMPLTPEDEALLDQADERYLVVVNKADLKTKISLNCLEGKKRFFVSALTGQGVEELKKGMEEVLSLSSLEEGIITGERQGQLCKKSVECLKSALHCLENGFPVDVAAVDLQDSLEALWSIVGKNVRESVIDQIFSSFCVGK